MNTVDVRPAIAGWIFAILVLALFATGGGVSSTECLNGVCHVAYRTSPANVFVAILMLALLLRLRPRRGDDIPATPVKRRVRLAAFLIDFMSIVSLSGLAALIGLGTEAINTGQWSWAVERDFARSTDLLSGVVILALFGGWAYYFHRSIRLGIPTLGQYILGFRMVVGSKTGEPMRPIRHLFLAAYGCAGWPITLLLKDKDGDRSFWWNGIANTRAIHVSH